MAQAGNEDPVVPLDLVLYIKSIVIVFGRVTWTVIEYIIAYTGHIIGGIYQIEMRHVGNGIAIFVQLKIGQIVEIGSGSIGALA